MSDLTIVAIAVLTALPLTITSIAGLIVALRNNKQTKELHTMINSNLDKQIAASVKAAMAEGIAMGLKEGRALGHEAGMREGHATALAEERTQERKQ